MPVEVGATMKRGTPGRVGELQEGPRLWRTGYVCMEQLHCSSFEHDAHAASSSASARWANSEACCWVLRCAAGAWRGASTASSNTWPVVESTAWMWKAVALMCRRA